MSLWSCLLRLFVRPTPRPATVGVAVIVTDPLQAPVPGVTVVLRHGTAASLRSTNRDGYAAFTGIPKGLPVTVEVIGTGWAPYTGAYTFGAPNQDVPVTLHRVGAPRRPQAALGRIQGNFCNLGRDSQGRIMFDPYLASLDADGRRDWYARHRAAGSTHLVLSPSCAYNPEPWPGANFDWLADPQRFAALVREVIAEPSADGFGFTPILILDSGDPGIRSRMSTYWRGLRDAIGPDQVDCLVVPGWELIRASVTTSKEYSDALQLLRAQGWSHIWAHLSVERASFASNPVEVDDPWQGGESACWKSHGGEFVEGLLYQATAFNGDDAWLDRWDDVVPRIVQGMNGWRPVALCLFEAVAYGVYRGTVTPEQARDVATKGRDRARERFGVTEIGFGNGLPW